MEIIFDMPTKSVDEKNKLFESLLRNTLKSVLKSGTDHNYYCETVLDEMWNGKEYQSPDGTPFYYEIPKHDTANGLPVVVSM